MRALFVTWLALGLFSSSASAAFVPPGLHPGDQYHLVFVTSTVTGIDTDTSVPPAIPFWGGIAAADYLVTDSADAAGLIPGWNHVDILYHAILSDSTVDARDHINVQGPVYNTHGDLVATGAADLWDGTISAPIKYTEQGVEIGNNFDVWAGTARDGGRLGGTTGDWHDPTKIASSGSLLKVDGQWIQSSALNGDSLARLYGISGLLMVPVPEPSSVVLAAIALVALCLSRRVFQFRLMPSFALLARSLGLSAPSTHKVQ